MNKDFWDKVNRLEELAGKATQGEWANDHLGNIFVAPKGKENDYQAIVCLTRFDGDYVPTDVNAVYIAAANPAMIQEMIAVLRRLEKENEELRANNYGPEILNDPADLTVSYFAGRMAEGRERNAKEDKLLDEKERLEKEADWLAEMCKGFCCGHNYCNECVHYPRGCPISKEIDYRFDKHEVEDWRKEARKAISEADNA